MPPRSLAKLWARSLERSMTRWTRESMKLGRQQAGRVVQASVRAGRQATARAVAAAFDPPPGAGQWLPGVTVGGAGALAFRVYRPPGLRVGERRPLLVMLHGCGQDARSLAISTRMNRLADRERCLLLYPEQDRLAHPQGCWSWYDTRSGRAAAEADLIVRAIDQVALFSPVDPARVALVGMSAGAGMAALLATRAPARFQAVVMHSGVAPGAAHDRTSALRAMRGRPSPVALPEVALPPLLLIHGTLDGVVAARNARLAAAAWAEVAGAAEAASSPRRVQRGQRHPMQVTEYRRGGRTVVRLVEVEGLGHAWSGGAAGQPFSDPKGPDASRLAWQFVSRQWAG